ncbi:MAG TPA: sporulation integral membrane protein YtvI [Eubacteriales bacterium]|nr:sporulation integral membrane protein YtvI [Eubacteriales bacterium]
MEIEKRKRFIVNFLYFAIILGIVIVLTRYALGMLMPFLVALLVSLLLKPVVRFLREKWHLHKGIAGVLVVLLFYTLIGFLLFVIGVQIFSAAKSFFIRLPSLYTNSVAPWLSGVFASLQSFAEKLDPDTAAAYNTVASNVTETLGQTVVGISKQLVTWVTNVTIKTPGFLLKLLIAIIATVFLSIDFVMIKAFILRQFSEKNQALLHNIQMHLGRTLWRYTRSYALILFITFAEIALGLAIIGVEHAVGIAVAIALFDILPVVGSGMVLLPWTIIALISGNYARALGLGILYIVVIIVRNIMEPKIVGDRVGLHPIVTLFSMVLGTFLFGGIGLLGLPITLALIQSLNKQGVIHLYKTDDTPSVSKKEPADAPAACEAPHEPHAEPGAAAPAEAPPETKKHAGKRRIFRRKP